MPEGWTRLNEMRCLEHPDVDRGVVVFEDECEIAVLSTGVAVLRHGYGKY
jgi:hypothetical protein